MFRHFRIGTILWFYNTTNLWEECNVTTRRYRILYGTGTQVNVPIFTQFSHVTVGSCDWVPEREVLPERQPPQQALQKWNKGTYCYGECCGSGSGILVIFWPLDPRSGIGFSGSRISDPGSWIPNRYLWDLIDNYLGKKKLSIGSNFFSMPDKNKIIFSLEKFVATKKGRTSNFFPSSLVVVGSGIEIRDG